MGERQRERARKDSARLKAGLRLQSLRFDVEGHNAAGAALIYDYLDGSVGRVALETWRQGHAALAQEILEARAAYNSHPRRKGSRI